ncbi:MAG TPA: PilZ domain-containing protein [Longimicrobium sp.]|jgi:Tfp pilus assembly protein PilZ|uniref:PilZ domain-containing protein n=1 Tax=Longimicrobium sp. TaxID=2029185 RepID=UPI002ED8076B
MADDAAAPAERYNPRRTFIRHTAGVPLEVTCVPGSPASTRKSVNVSTGGLSFVSDEHHALGAIIQVRIPTVDPPFEARARVVWIKPEGDGYCVGVEFLDANDAFRSRMVEQVCAIEQYRGEVLENEGRDLTQQEAAAEWIGRFAGRFPDA